MGGMYLTAEEMAMLTSAPSVSTIGSFAGGFSAMTMVLGDIGSFGNTANAVNTLESLKPNIKSYLGNKVLLAQGLINVPLTTVPDFVENYLNNDVRQIVDLMKGGLWQGVGGLHATLFETMNGTSNLMGSYNNIIQKVGIDPKILRWANQKYQPNIPDMNIALRLKLAGVWTDSKYKENANMLGWSNDLASSVELITRSMPNPETLLQLLRRGVITDEQFKQMMRVLGFGDEITAMIARLRTQYVDPYRICDLVGRHGLHIQYAEEAFTAIGLPTDYIPSYIKALKQRLPIGTLAEMKWRGLINESQLDDQMLWMNLPEELFEPIIKMMEQIPPAQDIITMVVREAFQADNVVVAPSEFAKWMATKGFSQDWSDRYWTAHFTPIALNQAYDNLRRGYWDEAKFKSVLTIADIHPRWHDDIIKVAWQPPAIRELGYGYDVGVYSREDIIKYRRWGGLSIEDATKAADSLIDYRLDAERASCRRAYLKDFVDGARTEEEFRGKLTLLKTNQLTSDLWVEQGRILKAQNQREQEKVKPKKLTEADIEYTYVHELKQAIWYGDELKKLGYDDTSIARLIEIANDKIAKLHSQSSIEKELSLTYTHDCYIAGLIDRGLLDVRLTQMGYDNTDRNLMMELWDLEKNTVKASKQLTLSQIADLYNIGTITREKFKERIIALGYKAEDADLIISLADYVKPTVQKQAKLTESELEQLFLYGYYDINGLKAEYVKRGFSEQEAMLKTYISKIGIELPIIKAQYKNAWINENELATAIRTMIEPFNTLGNIDTIINAIMMAIVKNTQGERTEKERDLTKAEILKGAKNSVLTPAEAEELLVSMGYSQSEAQYLLVLNGIIAINDPRGYWDMKQAVELRRKALGQTYIDVPDQLIKLEADYKSARVTVNELKGKSGKEAELGQALVQQANLEAQINTIKSTLKPKKR